MSATPNLLVIRSPDIDRAVVFYQAIGLNFTKHAHGKGPEHFASESDGFVFEIYPLPSGGSPTTTTRLGFRVPDVDAAVAQVTNVGAAVVTPPRDSPWGRRAVVDDLDGHRVELTSPPDA